MTKAIKFLLSYFNIMPTTFIQTTWLFNVDMENMNFVIVIDVIIKC